MCGYCFQQGTVEGSPSLGLDAYKRTVDSSDSGNIVEVLQEMPETVISRITLTVSGVNLI